MKPKLAHHTPPKAAANDRELFRWNGETVDQFILVDPWNEGWELSVELRVGGVPAHLAMKAPAECSSPVFLVVRQEVGTDHVVRVVHDTCRTAQVGPVSRYAGPEDYLATVRDTRSATKEVQVVDSGDAMLLMSASGVRDAVVTTTARCEAGLIHLDDRAFLADKIEYLAEDARLVGFVVDPDKDGVEGTLRIFDFVVERIR